MLQLHFEFHEWEEAFARFYRERNGYELRDEDGSVLGFRKGNPDAVFVVSTDTWVSGYWIEEDAEDDAYTKVYRTVEAVKDLEARVRKARGATNALNMGGVIT